MPPRPALASVNDDYYPDRKETHPSQRGDVPALTLEARLNSPCAENLSLHGLCRNQPEEIFARDVLSREDDADRLFQLLLVLLDNGDGNGTGRLHEQALPVVEQPHGTDDVVLPDQVKGDAPFSNPLLHRRMR